MARIGIGCTSYKRPENLEEFREHIAKFTDWSKHDVFVHIALDSDEDRKGVSFRKNQNLRALKDCDYIFLFDDDTFPIKQGWIDNWINSNKDHYLYLNNTHSLIGKYDKDSYYRNCGGVFMYMTKSCLERVGAFNENFNMYGFEHAEWSIRAYSRFGVFDYNNYWCLNNTSDYIYAHDYSTPNHKSSITDEEKQKHIKENWNKFFNEPIKQIHIPL